MTSNKVLLLAVLSTLTVGCATQRTNNGLANTNAEYGYTKQVTAPPSANPGECYINLYNKPVTQTSSQQVLVKAASQSIEVIPATYTTGEERILVKPATTMLEIVPATYTTVDEQVLVKPASTRLVPVAAMYEDKSEQIMVKPARTFWKRSTAAEAARSGSREQIAGDDGYIMCLIEEPATFKTVTNQVMTKGPSTTEEAVPAEYTTVKKTVLKTPATTREVTVPAEYAMIPTTKIATPASEKITEIPAQYETLESSKVVSEGKWEWRQILCATNSTPSKLQEIESALSAAGQNPGNVDGVVDNSTLSALQAYQSAKNLPLDRGRYINIETVQALGVSPK